MTREVIFLPPLATDMSKTWLKTLTLLASLAALCHAQCYEAYLPDFPTCQGYPECGYTCVGSYCASNSCQCSCTACANFVPNAEVDLNTGRCIPNTSSTTTASATTSTTATIGFDATAVWPYCSWAILEQGTCGSCYSFSAIETLTARLCITENTDWSALWSNATSQFRRDLRSAVFISPNNILGCSSIQASAPCNGGNSITVLNNINKFSKQLGTCVSETGSCSFGCLPYSYGGLTGDLNVCNASNMLLDSSCSGQCVQSGQGNPLPLPYIFSTSYIPPFSPNAIMAEIKANGPVSVAIRVPSSGTFFKYWNSLNSLSPTVYLATDEDYANGSDGHAVQIVGWTMIDGCLAWKVRNSWGATSLSGGADGYFYVPIGEVVANMFIEYEPVTVWLGQNQGWSSSDVNPDTASATNLYNQYLTSSQLPTAAASMVGDQMTHAPDVSSPLSGGITVRYNVNKYLSGHQFANSSIADYMNNFPEQTIAHIHSISTQVVQGMRISTSFLAVHRREGTVHLHNVSFHLAPNLTSNVLQSSVHDLGSTQLIFNSLAKTLPV